MTMILIDSDVVLDIFLDREPFCTAALTVFLRIEQGYCQGYISATAIANIYYTTRKELGRTAAINGIKRLLGTDGLRILAIGRHEIEEAVFSEMTDFEDAIQAIAADFEGIEYIVTRNLKDYHKSTVPALSPTQLLERLETS